MYVIHLKMIALLPLDVCAHVSQILHKLQCDFNRENVFFPICQNLHQRKGDFQVRFKTAIKVKLHT